MKQRRQIRLPIRPLPLPAALPAQKASPLWFVICHYPRERPAPNARFP